MKRMWSPSVNRRSLPGPGRPGAGTEPESSPSPRRGWSAGTRRTVAETVWTMNDGRSEDVGSLQVRFRCRAGRYPPLVPPRPDGRWVRPAAGRRPQPQRAHPRSTPDRSRRPDRSVRPTGRDHTGPRPRHGGLRCRSRPSVGPTTSHFRWRPWPAPLWFSVSLSPSPGPGGRRHESRGTRRSGLTRSSDNPSVRCNGDGRIPRNQGLPWPVMVIGKHDDESIVTQAVVDIRVPGLVSRWRDDAGQSTTNRLRASTSGRPSARRSMAPATRTVLDRGRSATATTR